MGKNKVDHNYKKFVVKAYQAITGNKVLIETGTYYGEMVKANIDNFERIISIELSDKLYRMTVERFKDYNQIELHHGDSTDILPKILAELKEPAIFWLDGHYSAGVTARGRKDTPIREELSYILNHPLRHTILIDDARCFTGENDYPTLKEIKNMAGKYKYSLVNDIIRLT